MATCSSRHHELLLQILFNLLKLVSRESLSNKKSSSDQTTRKFVADIFVCFQCRRNENHQERKRKEGYCLNGTKWRVQLNEN